MKISKGFTLLELLITIVVVGVLAIMAAPMYQNIFEDNSVNESSTSLTKALHQARSKAILQKEVITLNLNNGDPNTDTTINWKGSGTATLVKSTAVKVFFGPNGFSQKSATDPAPSELLTFRICNAPIKTATISRTITMSYLGSMGDTGLKGECNAK